MVERDDCAVCGFARIPGVTACINCGEPDASAFGGLEVYGHELAPLPDHILEEMADGDVPKLTYPGHRITPEQYRWWIEARALEYTDVSKAMAMYEGLVRERCLILEVHKRLAILYRKAKLPHDEERVIREALSLVSGPRTSWFVLRLTKILAGKTPPQA